MKAGSLWPLAHAGNATLQAQPVLNSDGALVNHGPFSWRVDFYHHIIHIWDVEQRVLVLSLELVHGRAKSLCCLREIVWCLPAFVCGMVHCNAKLLFSYVLAWRTKVSELQVVHYFDSLFRAKSCLQHVLRFFPVPKIKRVVVNENPKSSDHSRGRLHWWEHLIGILQYLRTTFLAMKQRLQKQSAPILLLLEVVLQFCSHFIIGK